MPGYRLPAVVLAAALMLPALAGAAERSEVPDRYKWDLNGLFKDDAAWAAARKELDAAIPHVTQWQGKLGESSANLVALVNETEKLGMQADRIYVYGSQRYDEDTRVSRTMQMQQQALQAYTDLQSNRVDRREPRSASRPSTGISPNKQLKEYQVLRRHPAPAPHTRARSEEDRRADRPMAGCAWCIRCSPVPAAVPEMRCRRARRCGSMRLPIRNTAHRPWKPIAMPCSTRSGRTTASSRTLAVSLNSHGRRTSSTRTCATSAARPSVAVRFQHSDGGLHSCSKT
jgi:hypothetical protein